MVTEVVTRPRSDVTTIFSDGYVVPYKEVVTRPRSDVTTILAFTVVNAV